MLSDGPLHTAQLAAELGAVFIGLAYVSGYIIVNTYLGSFGISGDSGGLVKAKYIYVGFLYLLFMCGFVLFFAAVKKLLDWVVARYWPGAYADEQPNNCPPELIEKHKTITPESFLVWVGVALVFEIPIALQITFLQPRHVKDFLLVQLALLCSVFLYQGTYYRGYREYKWDRASSLVLSTRRWSLGLETVAACFVLLTLVSRQSIATIAAGYGHLSILWWVAIPVAPVLLLIWIFRPLFLTTTERMHLEAGGHLGWSWIRRWPPKAFVLFMVFFCLIATPTIRGYWVRWWIIQAGTLFMAITVLCGVPVLSLQANQRRDREVLRPTGRKPVWSVAPLPQHEDDKTERWVRWILRCTSVVTLYVMTTLGYAYVVYPHIPVQKAGGDYTTSPVVQIKFKHGVLNLADLGDDVQGRKSTSFDLKRSGDVCVTVMGADVCSDMIVLDQDASFIYAARIDDFGDPTRGDDRDCGPKKWRDGILERNGPYRPRVFAISLSDVIGVYQESKKYNDEAYGTDTESCYQ
jgi:hypothetical protein